MTCNQLIALLEVYRTGKPSKSARGTIKDDLLNLRSNGLIETEVDGDFVDREWSTTEEGMKKVEALLVLMSGNKRAPK